MELLELSIPLHMKQQAEHLSAQKKCSLNDLATEALRQYIQSEQIKAVRSQTLPLAEAQGYLTDDDIFEVVS